MRLAVCVVVFVGLASVGRADSSMALLRDFQGIRFTEVGRPVGMPMGGVGAGCVEITSQGRLAEFANVNNWAARIPSMPGTGLFLSHRAGATTIVRDLGQERIRFEGNFPFAKLTFPDLPVELTLWCWSPFVLHDLRHSAYPVAIFDAEIKNTRDQKAEIGLVLSYGTDYGQWLRRLTTADASDLPVTITSSSADYKGEAVSGIRFSTRADLDSEAFQAAVGKIKLTLESAYLRPYTHTPLDIRPACNRSYLRSPFGSDPGNAPLNFADLKPGRQLVYGIPFDVTDDEGAGGKSMVMAGPPAGTASVTMPVKQQADCLFVLGNCAGWANAPGSAAEYVVRYADGSTQTVPLRTGRELSDWMGGEAVYCPAHVTGSSSKGTSYVVHLFAIPTDGSKQIESVELRQSGGIAPIVFAVTLGSVSDMPIAENVAAMRRVDIDRMTGSLESAKLVSNTNADYTLAARHVQGATVHTYRESRPECLMATIGGGSCPPPLPREDGTIPTSDAPAIYAVEQRFRLEPGERAVAGLVCAWYAPNHCDRSGHRFGHKYEEWFADSAAVAEEVAREHDKLLRDTKASYDLIATSTLPKWYREMLQSNFYLMPACSWWTREGITFLYETPDGCPLFGTMDVRYYGSFQKLAAFPELDAQVLRQFAAAQNPDGFIVHDLGGTSGLVDNYSFPPDKPTIAEPSSNRHDYDGYWVNLPIKFCLEVARHYQWTGNRDFLREMWPHVKRAIKWVRAQDEDNDGLPETNYGYDGWKMIDKSNYDANQWLAMLLAVARLADDLGERSYAGELRAIHRKALAQIERLLWTGRYFRQAVHNDTGNNDMVSILQVAGDWYADILGFADGLPREQVRSALRTIDEVNGEDARYGATDCLFPDGSRNDSWICIGQAVGWQYSYASHCMYEGLDDIALRIADETWWQFTVEKARIPWCQEEFIPDPPKGECPYWLLRDMRMGSAMVMSYAAAGLKMDVPRRTAEIRPANWVWKQDRFVLPILLPKWLGQVSYRRYTRTENYYITNLEQPVVLASLKLRTVWKGSVQVTIDGRTRQVPVAPDGAVDVGRVKLGDKLLVRIVDAG